MTLESLLHPVCLSEMVRLAESTPPGPLVEVGVYKGGSAYQLARVAREQGRELHLFDTFAGIPYSASDDPHPVGDFADTDLSAVKRLIPEAVYHVGIFPWTLPVTLVDVAFAHVDCDQYESYRACLDRLWPRVVPGGIMLFDDYPYLAGARRAVDAMFTGTDLLWTTLACRRAYVVKR